MDYWVISIESSEPPINSYYLINRRPNERQLKVIRELRSVVKEQASRKQMVINPNKNIDELTDLLIYNNVSLNKNGEKI